MKLSLPAEMDESAGEDSGKQSGSSGKQSGSGEKLRDQTVSLFDEGSVMDPLEAIELLGEMLDRPEAFGMVAESSHEELAERVEALEEENERLAESLRSAYEVLDEQDSIKSFSIDRSVYDPTEEFK